MGNENGNGSDVGASAAGARPDDPLRVFCVNLGLSISESGRRVASLGEKLSRFSVARRRAAGAGFLEEIDEIISALADGKEVIREALEAEKETSP